MKIGMIQCNPVTGDCAGNANMLFSLVQKVAQDGATFCVAPELVICGANAEDLLRKNFFLRNCAEELERLAERLAGENLPPLLLGAPIEEVTPQGKVVYSAAVLLDKGNVSVIAKKILLSSHNNAIEQCSLYEPASACGIVEVNGARIATAVGQDTWNSKHFLDENMHFATGLLADLLASQKADCIINISAIPYASGNSFVQRKMLGKLASHYQTPVLGVNLVGGNDGILFYGKSAAFNKEGSMTAYGAYFEESVCVVDINDETPCPVDKGTSSCHSLWKALVLGTKDFAKKCGIPKAIVGLSGGVDSALVACIAVEALGAEHVTGVLMPSPYSSDGSVNDALALAKNLGIKTHTIPLLPMLDAYRSSFAHVFSNGLQGVAEENIQARIRGALLMAFGNEQNALVLNTGNKSEAAVGYCTLYGDQVGALCVIGDLYKKQVYAVCHWINRSKNNLIPDAILSKAPSAELRPDQKDSDSLPPYDILDGILFEIFDNGKGSGEIIAMGYDKYTVKEVFSLVHRAQFKRKQAPPALQVSMSSFSAVWNIPIASKVNFR